MITTGCAPMWRCKRPSNKTAIWPARRPCAAGRTGRIGRPPGSCTSGGSTSSSPVTPRHRAIAPKGLAQKRYVEAIRTHDLTFCIGPAGTGKTYLAMAMAVQGLVSRAYKRIVLARPAVEAGESLGYLPGDLYEKVSPYLRPLYDALYDMMEVDKI